MTLNLLHETLSSNCKSVSVCTLPAYVKNLYFLAENAWFFWSVIVPHIKIRLQLENKKYSVTETAVLKSHCHVLLHNCLAETAELQFFTHNFHFKVRPTSCFLITVKLNKNSLTLEKIQNPNTFKYLTTYKYRPLSALSDNSTLSLNHLLHRNDHKYTRNFFMDEQKTQPTTTNIHSQFTWQ